MTDRINVQEGMEAFFDMKDQGLTAKKINDFLSHWEEKEGRPYLQALKESISVYAKARQVPMPTEPPYR